MVLTACDCAAIPGIDQIDGERRMHADGGMQTGGRLPGAVAHRPHLRALATHRMQRQGMAIDEQRVAPGDQTAGRHLDALDRRIDEAHRATGGPLLAHHRPGLERHAQVDLHTAGLEIAEPGEAELEVRCEPVELKVVAGRAQIVEHIAQVLAQDRRQHEAVVQRRAPARQPGGHQRITPESGNQRADQQLLQQAHLGVRRHLEAAHLEQAQAAAGRVGGIELVDAELGAMGVAGDIDQQIAQQPVDQPGRAGLHTLRLQPGELAEGNLELANRVEPRLVDARRLAGRTDEQARKQIRQGRVRQPPGDQTGQQVGATQKRRVGGRGATEHHMVAAAGADMAAIEHELLGGQAGQVGGLVELRGAAHQLIPARARMDIDFDHARIGGDAQHRQAGVARRLIALEDHLQAGLAGARLDRCDQLKILIEGGGRRHEDIETAVTRLDAQRGPGNTRIGSAGGTALAVAGIAPDLLHHTGGRLATTRDRLDAARRDRLGHRILARIVGCAQLKLMRREQALRLVGVGRMNPGIVGLGHPGQRGQRQPVADRRIAGRQKALVHAQGPGAGLPQLHRLPDAAGRRSCRTRGRAGARIRLDRQNPADRLAQAVRKDPMQTLALHRIVEPGIEHINIDRQLLLAMDEVHRILISLEGPLRIDAQPGRDIEYEFAGLRDGRDRVRAGARHQVRQTRMIVNFRRQYRQIADDRLAVASPEPVERPARQLLARIPFALPVVQQTLIALTGAQPLQQFGRQPALVGAQRLGIPLGAVAVVDRHESGLTALGQAHVARDQIGIDLAPERIDRLPLQRIVGFGDPRRLEHPPDRHRVNELAAGRLDQPGERRGRCRIGRAGDRDMAFAGHQTRGRIQPDPAGARQIDLAPGMQVGEIMGGALRPVERLHIGHQLDQVSRDKAGRQAQAAQQLYQQPGRVATGPRAQLEGLLGRLHARLHADQVADVVLQALVEANQKIDGSHRLARDLAQPLLDARRERQACQIGREFVALGRFVAERAIFGVGLEKEIEGIEDRHLGDEVDFNREFGDALRKHRAGEPV